MTKGCYTCRRRRIICDNGKPTCRKCRDAGKECLGYQKPLVWVKGGVASRGKMMGRSFDDVKSAGKPNIKSSVEAKPEPTSEFASISISGSSSRSLLPGGTADVCEDADTWVHGRMGEADLGTGDEDSSFGLSVSEDLDRRMVHVPRGTSAEYVPAPWGLVDPLHKDLNQASRFYLYHCREAFILSCFLMV